MFTFIIFFIITILLLLTNCKNLHNSKNISTSDRKFRVVYEWNTIDFIYRNDSDRKRAIFTGEFIRKHILISDVEAFGNRLYLTMPRLLNGVPATLGWIISPYQNARTNPAVQPYPSWEYNREGDCRAMQFVRGIAIDREGFMWVVDSGKSQTLLQGNPKVSCIPKLLIMDLKRNGAVTHIYEFPEEVVARGKNYLSKIVIDDTYGGFAYITDNNINDPGIVVYSRKLNHSWKVREKNSMSAATDATNVTINGTNIRVSFNINSIALGPYYKSHITDAELAITNKTYSYERNVYYSPLSSYHLYSIPASILRDANYSANAVPGQIFESVTDYGVKKSQTDGMIMDNRGILYFSLLQKYAIGQWNSFEPFIQKNQRIIARDKNFIQWVDGMTFDQHGNIFVVVNRFYNYLAGRLNPNEINFRILKATVGGQSYIFTNTPHHHNKSSLTLNVTDLSSKIRFNYWSIIFGITIGRLLR